MEKSASIIAVGRNIKVFNRKRPVLKIQWLELLCVILFSFGAMKILNGSIGVVYTFNTTMAVLGFSLLFSFCWGLKRFSLVAISGSLAIFVGIIIAYIRPFTLSVFYLNQLLLSKFNAVFGKSYRYYTAYMTTQELQDVKFLLSIVLPLLICFIIAAITVKRRMPILMLILSCLFLYLEFFLNVEPNYLSVLAIIVSVGINYSLQSCLMNANYTKPLVSYRDIFRSHYVVSDLKTSSLNLVGILLVFTVVFIAVSLPIITSKSKDSNNDSQTILSHFTKMIDYFSTGTPSIIDDIFNKSNSASGGISGGTPLGRVESVKFTGDIHAKVRGDITFPLYLKGFVGEEYNGSKWGKSANPEVERQVLEPFSKAMGPFLLASNFPAFLEQTSAAQGSIMALRGVLEFEIVSKKVDFLLQPYFLSGLDLLANSSTDDDFPLGNTSNYTADCFLYFDNKTGNPTWDPNDFEYYSSNYSTDYGYSSQYSTTIGSLASYYNYASAEYTKLPKINVGFLNDIKSQLGINTSASSPYAVANAVKAYLNDNMTYTLSPGKTPLNADFAEYFLTQSKKGYCTHFATSGALILRYLGVPARYVEGYAAFSPSKPDDYGYYPITDKNAHAWVEIYDPFVGWIPFEMTPPDGLSNPTTGGQSSVPSSQQSHESSSPTPSEPSSLPQSSSPQSIGSTPTSVNSGGEDAPNTPEKSSPFVAILLISLLVVTAIIVLLVLGLRRYRVILFTQKDRNKAVIEIYSRIQKLISKKGVSSMSDLQYYAKIVSDTLKIDDFVEVTDIVLKARFSQHTITETEYLLVFNCLEGLK